MKILELRFKNLNSLQGEWKIDFTDPEYINNGIFALTGPTGAGKSTILDAICLALYGETPRLGKITKSDNEIMSRHTGECYAEVVFQSQAGTYRCHWEQRKARKSADGNLQDQEHQIAEADTGKLIESKKSRVVSVIEEKTGMDFKRFNRSILLAQGSFDSFLKADVGQKSEILEQITGTSIYSNISKLVHERKRGEEQKLELLQAEIKGIQLLTDDEIIELTELLNEKKIANLALKAEFDKTKQSVDWLKNIEQLKQSIIDLQTEKTLVKGDIERFIPKKSQLSLANKATLLDGEYAILQSNRAQKLNIQQSLSAKNEELPLAENALVNANEGLAKTASELQVYKQSQKEQLVIWQEVRNLDYALSEKRKAYETQNNAIQLIQANIALNEKKLSDIKSEQLKLQQSSLQSEKYLMDYKADEWLVNHFFAVKTEINQLKTQNFTIEQQQKELDGFVQQIKTVENNIVLKTQSLASITDEKNIIEKQLKALKVEQEKTLNGKSLAEYRGEKESLLREQLLLNRIASLEDERARLIAGESCPLCGSKDHPFTEGRLPEQDHVAVQIAELDKKIVRIEAQAQQYLNDEKKLTEIVSQFTIQTAELAQLNEKLQSSLEAQSKTQTALQKSQSDYQQLKQGIDQALESLNIVENLSDHELVDHLQARLTRWQVETDQVEKFKNQQVTINNEIQQLTTLMINRQEELSLKQTEITSLQDLIKNELIKRANLFGDKNVAEEEKKLSEQIQKSEQNEQKARELQIEASQKLALLKQSIDQLTKSLAQIEIELESLEQKFIASLASHEFLDETAFKSAQLPSDERERLSLESKRLEMREADILSREKDRMTQLKNEEAKKITEESLALLSERLVLQENKLNAEQEEATKIEYRLSENTKALSRIEEKKSAIDEQRSECLRWDKLHALIGSSDGKKYRNFAQGLTFELMVNHANRQLEKMTDRYLLMRDKEEPLKLNVIDNYQAGEVRSTKNLSGGESFIISLALALGLSKMASQKVRVDSLFLDEGFGTLDEEALDTALSVLSNLHGEGKLIGVISHVSALKERIQTQIQIRPISGGRSEIIGAGCERL